MGNIGIETLAWECLRPSSIDFIVACFNVMSESPLKILTVMPDFGLRGTQRVAQLFSVAFRQMGHDVSVWALSPEGPRRAMFEEAGIRIIDGSSSLEQNLAQIQALSPDVIHIHRAGPPQTAMTMLLHQLRPFTRLIVETNIFGRYDPTASELIDVHFQLTHSGLYRWNCLAAPPKRRTSVSIYIPNPVDFTAFYRENKAEIERHRAEKFGAERAEFIFGRCGKTEPKMLDTFRKIVDQNPNVRLISMGDNDNFHQYTSKQPVRVRDRVTIFPSTRSDAELRMFYSSIDALLHWSYVGESFGMVLAESIACGTPVVMPLQLDKDIGGVEVIGHGEGGLIAGHSGLLDRAALEMIRTRQSFDHGPLQAARERLIREYEVNHVAAKSIDAFHLALEAKRLNHSLQSAFANHSKFVSHVPRQWFKQLISKRLGPASARERIRHRFTHNGWLVRARYRIVPVHPPQSLKARPGMGATIV